MLLATLVLAGCGSSGPHLARRDAAPLITLADKIAREGACAQARDIRALSALRLQIINAHKVPTALQEPLSSGVNALVAQTQPCLPPVAVAPPTPEHGPEPKPPGPKHDHHGKDKGGGH